MPNIRVMPPGNGLQNTIRINGRTYTQTPGNTLDVPDFDAQIMIFNGWLPTAGSVVATVGATAARPAAPFNGQSFLDTTVGALVTFYKSENVWRHHVTGAAA